MGKKKKSSSATANAAATADGSSTVPTSAAGASPSAVASASPNVPLPAITQPWVSNYEGLKITPIVADSNLFLATDPLSQKVNTNPCAGTESDAQLTSGSVRKFQFGIYDSKADTVGRRAIALRAIPAGTLLLSEHGQPWIAHAEHASKVCHQCAKCIYDPRVIEAKTTKEGTKAPASRFPHCTECETAFYCSPECLSAHKPIHSLECPALQQAEEMSDLAKINIDIVRAAIKYVVAKGMEAQKDAASGVASLSISSSSSSSSPSVYDPYHFLSTPSDCELLMDHMNESNPVDLRNMRDAASLILKSLPSSFNLPIDRIVSFMCRLNSNCHALNLEEHATIQFGFGLYPLCAIFNHSCYPNCIFINEGSNLTFRVIRDVEKHEELTVNYVSLYAPRTIRRKELWDSKKFFCQCRRCNLKPKNEEEKVKFALDQYLGAISCQNVVAPAAASSSSAKAPAAGAKCTGFYRINYQMRDAKVEAERKRKRKEEKAAKKAAAAGGDASSSTSSSAPEEVVEVDTSKPNESVTITEGGAAEESSSDDDDDETSPDEYPLSLRPKVTSCRCNVCHHNANATQLTAVQTRAFEESERLLAMYGTGQKSPQQIKDEFEAFFKEQSNILHPQHAVLFNLLLPLVNVTSALAEWKVKLEYCKRVVTMAESVFPNHFLPTCNYYQALSNTYKQLISKGIKENVPKKMLQKYKEEQIAVLEKLAHAMRICRGEKHILTLAAQHDVSEAKKIKFTL